MRNIHNVILKIILCRNTNFCRYVRLTWARWLKRQGAGLWAGWPGCRRGGDFSSLLRIQTGPEVHSASYKMSTEGFPLGVKAAKLRTGHPTSSQCHGCEYVDPCIHILRGPSWSVMGIHLPLNMWTLASTSPVGLHGL